MSSAEATLAGRLFARLGAGSPDANLAFSPTSIRAAAVMAYVGARGATADELRETLEFGPVAVEVQRTRAMLHALHARDGMELRMANRFFGERAYPFAADYVSTLREGLDAEPEALDFVSAAEASRAHINAWVAARTENRIRGLLGPGTVSAETRLVLANAIYFKSAWADPFSERWTKPGPFFGPRETTAQFMHKVEQFPYAETDDMQLVALPYAAADLAMVVLLPKPHLSLAAVEAPGALQLLAAGLSLPPSRLVSVQLPRFEVTSSFRLEEPLEAMGLRTAFRYPEADFSGMDGTRDFFLGAAVHEAFVNVDEKGTEAAAATALTVVAGGPPPKPVRFRADRPFLFAVVERTTRSVLFLGRVAAPLLLALVLLAACAEQPLVLPPEPATIVLTPPPVTSGPPATKATVPPVDAQGVASPNGLDVPARDPRRVGVRPSALLANEISGLESLRKAWTPSFPTPLPALLRRLAEDYVELRKSGTPSASQDAIARYEELVRSYPSEPMADEVLYYLGLESEISGDLIKARKVYFALISGQPASSFVPFAYFAFGEMFLREAKADPSKLPLAQAAYAQTLKGAKPTLVPDVLWRSGQVEDLLGDSARAQWFYDRLKREYPTSAAAARIGDKP